MNWVAFYAHGRDGGNITGGVTLNSGVLNPDLLTGQPGADVWVRPGCATALTRSSPTSGRNTAKARTKRR